MNVLGASITTKGDRAVASAVMAALPHEASGDLVSFQLLVDPLEERTTSPRGKRHSSTRSEIPSSRAGALTAAPLAATGLPHNDHQVLTFERMPVFTADGERRGDGTV
jgi:hypothetical protein